MGPMRTMARASERFLTSSLNPFAASYPARATAAACDIFVDATRRYDKPEFGLTEVEIATETATGTAAVTPEVVLSKPFCDLLHFRRSGPAVEGRNDPAVLIVAPMSGHFATLLRGTVEAMLPANDVYVTDWANACEVPLADGAFDLADYTDYIMAFCRHLARRHGRVALMAVCQPGVPVLIAASLMAEDDDPARPASIVLMGSPIDTRINQTEPCRLAQSRPLSWFEQNVVVTVPWPNPGFLRRVYPGFVQLSGFMSMNMDRHLDAHFEHFQHLVRGDGDSVVAHHAFYDEYRSVMDLAAEFYLQTVEAVFQKHLLPRGEYRHHDRLVRPQAIRDIGLMTIEGEKDDITGRGQTRAAQGLAAGLPDELRAHFVQPKVGHYGVFNGSRFRSQIRPRIQDFIQAGRARTRG